jgi:hypothetical protein
MRFHRIRTASEHLAIALRGGTEAGLSPPRWPASRMGKPGVDLEDRNALERALYDTPTIAGKQEAQAGSQTS